MIMKRIFAVLLALVLCFSAVCLAEANSDLAYVKGKGKLIVGITDFAPMDYKNDNGEWIGFDADMAKAFAASLGVEVEFIEIDWDNKIMELDNKFIDVVWNGMTLTEDVKAAMECSNAYANNAQVVIVPVDVADQYQTVESVANLTFAVENGSAGQTAAQDIGVKNIVALQDQAAALMEVAAGTADACVIDITMAYAMTGEGTNYADLAPGISLTEELYGVSFRKGSDLAPKFNEFMAGLKKDGTLQALADKYDLTLAD
jgi:polar amino acid transport system substrate-binding protein